MESGNKAVYNVVSAIFLILSLLVCLVTLSFMSGTVAVPEAFAPAAELVIPTFLPTSKPSNTPRATNTLFPTNTPIPSPTWTPTNTQTATFTPSVTFTEVPPTVTPVTPTQTPIPPTQTPTGLPPTATPASIFDHTIQVTAAPNGNCNFSGFAGRVLNLNGQRVNGVGVWVTGPGVDGYTVTADDPVYGAGGYQAKVA